MHWGFFCCQANMTDQADDARDRAETDHRPPTKGRVRELHCVIGSPVYGLSSSLMLALALKH